MYKILSLALLLLCINILSAQPVDLQIRAYAQGYYSPTLMQMVPVVDPVGNPTICDTASIVLIDSLSGQSVYCGSSVFTIQGYGSITLPTSFFNSSYLVGVRFRNTLHIVSKNTIHFSSQNISVDLTDPASVCCDFDSTHGVATAYSGDINRDGAIDGSDVTIIENDFINGLSGYLITDLDGDGQITLADFNLATDNNNLFLYDVYGGLCITTGMYEYNYSDLKFRAFPNPFDRKFTISISELIYEIEVSITDIYGKNVYVKNFYNQQELLINPPVLQTGIYLVQIKTGNNVRIIKMSTL